MEHSGSPRHVIIRQTPNEYRLHCSRHRSDNGLGCNRRPRSTSDRCVPHIRLYDVPSQGAWGFSSVQEEPSTDDQTSLLQISGKWTLSPGFQPPNSHILSWNTSAPAPSRAANAAFSVTQRHSYLALIAVCLLTRLTLLSFLTEIITHSRRLIVIDSGRISQSKSCYALRRTVSGATREGMASMMSCCSRSASAHSMSPKRSLKVLRIFSSQYSSSFQCGDLRYGSIPERVRRPRPAARSSE